MMLRLWCLLAVTTATGCRTPPALRNCGDDLSGQWLILGEPGRWTLRDSATRIDGFPLDPDHRTDAGDVLGAPRWLELVRDHDVIVGRMHRRYMRRAQRCESTASLRIIACHDQRMDVERSALLAPTNMQPCSWPPASSKVQEQWQRVSQ